MDMSGMSGMGGMDMGSNGLFKTTNLSIAKSFWYIIAAFVALRSGERIYSHFRTWKAKRSTLRSEVPSRPESTLSRAHDTMAAILREITYPQLIPFKGSVARHFSLPPLGNCLILAAYWIMVLTMLWTNVILTPSSPMYAYKWEKVGFRAAWVSVTQLPLLYCLGGKYNIVSALTGVSYERMNWLHHWIARTMFLTVIVHWTFFFTEWSIADFVKLELQMMPMVKYGFGAWAVLGWSVITSFGFVRNLSYEVWVLQHLASAGVLLWLLYVHVPVYARYNIYLSIGFVAFDRGMRTMWLVAHNLRWLSLGRWRSSRDPWVGFASEAEILAHNYLHLRIHNINFCWKSGQHIYISIPSCGFWESHPFTIATESPSNTNHPRTSQSIDLYFKAHSGFTKRLLRKAEAHADYANQISGPLKSRVFLSRPFGSAPLSTIERCDSLILIASSTGASFTVPILEHAIRHAKFVRRIKFYWIVRDRQQLGWFHDRIVAVGRSAKEANIAFDMLHFVTGPPGQMSNSAGSSTSNHRNIFQHPEEQRNSVDSDAECSADSLLSRRPTEPGKASTTEPQQTKAMEAGPSSSAFSDEKDATRLQTVESWQSKPPQAKGHFVTNNGRPSSWDDLIHPTVIASEGETAVLACGGRALIADIRNYVARLSDERAVHKGTGAQGIFLFTETYGW